MKKKSHQEQIEEIILSIWDSSGTGKDLFLQLLGTEIRNFSHADLYLEIDEAPRFGSDEQLYQNDIHWDIKRKMKPHLTANNNYMMAINNQSHHIRIIEPFRRKTNFFDLKDEKGISRSDVVIILIDAEKVGEGSDITSEGLLKLPQRKRPDGLVDLSKYVRKSIFFRQDPEDKTSSQSDYRPGKLDKDFLIKSIDLIIQQYKDNVQQFVICVIYQNHVMGTANVSPYQDFQNLFGAAYEHLVKSWMNLPVLVGSIRNGHISLSKFSLNATGGCEVHRPSCRFLLNISEQKERNRIAILESNVFQVRVLGSKQDIKKYIPYFK